MNIISTSQDAKEKEDERARASIGCFICPCCGESRVWGEIHNKPLERPCIDKGVQQMIPVRVESCKGIFSTLRSYSQDMFECHTCGATWTGEPYDEHPKKKRFFQRLFK